MYLNRKLGGGRKGCALARQLAVGGLVRDNAASVKAFGDPDDVVITVSLTTKRIQHDTRRISAPINRPR